VKTIEDARLYLVASAQLEAGRLSELIGDLAGAGVDLVQLREKELDGGEVLELGAEVADACRSAGIPFVINDRPDIALALECGLHLGQDDVPAELARRIIGEAPIGRSTHSREQVAAELAASPRPNYIAVGPVYATPTKPGRPGTGLDLIRFAAETAGDLPWFAIGGIDETNLDDVIGAGARRVVVVRAITEATDPVGAAARLRRKLDANPLGAR
jgi:thiamine-phosphate pyrophosphorylase